MITNKTTETTTTPTTSHKIHFTPAYYNKRDQKNRIIREDHELIEERDDRSLSIGIERIGL